MRHQKQSSQARGQADIFGKVSGLSRMINPTPNVVDSDGFSVVHLVISEENDKIPGYRDEALKQARALLPEVKSIGKPVWMNPEWQAKRRKYGPK